MTMRTSASVGYFRLLSLFDSLGYMQLLCCIYICEILCDGIARNVALTTVGMDVVVAVAGAGVVGVGGSLLLTAANMGVSENRGP